MKKSLLLFALFATTLGKMKSQLAPHLKKSMDPGREEEPEQFYGVMKKQWAVLGRAGPLGPPK